MADVLDTPPVQEQPAKADAGLMERLFQGTEGWDSFLSPEAASGVRNALAGSTDEKADRMRMANTAFLADAFGKSPDEVAPLYEQFRDSWAQQILGADAPQMDDAGFYGAIGQHLQQQKAENAMLQRVSLGMFEGFRKGQSFDEAFGQQQLDNQWLDSWNDEHTDAYREMQRQAWDMRAARGAQLEEPIADATNYFTRARARSMTADDQRILRDRLTDFLAPLSPEDREFVLAVGAGSAAASTQEAEGGQVLQRLKRGKEAFGGAILRGVDELTSSAVGVGPSANVLREDVARQIDRRVFGEIDPARADSAVANGFLNTAEALPKILSSLNPVGVAALALSIKDEARSSFIDRGVPEQEADRLSYLVAVPETALQFVSGRMVLGKTGLSSLLRPIQSEAGLSGGALVQRYLTNLGIEAPAFAALTEAQTLTPLAVQAVASTLDRSVPGVNFSEFTQAAKEPLTPEGLASMAPLLIFAAGAGTFHDRASGLAYVQDVTRLRAAGYSESVVRDVLAAKSPEDAQLILRLNKPELGTPRQADAIEALDAEVATLPTGYRFEQSDEHGLVVYDERNFPVGSARSPEMAARIAQDHAAQREAGAEEHPFEEQLSAEERLRQSRQGGELLREQLAAEQAASDDMRARVIEQVRARYRMIDEAIVGREAEKKAQREQALAALQARYRSLDEAIVAREQARSGQLRNEAGIAPAAPSRAAGGQPSESIAREVDRVTKASAGEFTALGKTNKEGLTGYAYELGLTARTPADVEALRTAARTLNEQASEILKSGNMERFDEAMVMSTKAQIMREAAEAATGEASAGKFLRENRPDYVPPVPVESLKQPVPESGFLTGSKLEAWANKKIGEGRILTGLDPELLAAFAVKGAAILERGVRDFARWSGEMVKQFGESIRPHLDSIYREALGRMPPEQPKAAVASKIPGLEKRVPKEVFDAREPVKPAEIEKLVAAIAAAKPIVGQTERLYHQERVRRAARMSSALERQRGEGAIRSLRSAMAGQLPRVDIEPLRPQFTPAETESLFNHIQTHASLEGMVYGKARLSIALQALLDHGTLPTRGDIAMFEKVFGPQFSDALLAKRSFGARLADFLSETINIPRTLLSAYDLSASLRQGFSLAVSHPVVAKEAFAAQLRAFASHDYAASLDRAFHSGPQAKVRDGAGLELPSLEGFADKMTDREEAFMSRMVQRMANLHATNAAAKALFGPFRLHAEGIKASERAYVTYLNKLRVEVFDAIDLQLQQAGLSDVQLARERHSLALFINAATGRGNVKTSAWVNALFFSPKFMASRFEYPVRTAWLASARRGPLQKEAVRQLVAQTFVWTSLYALGAAAASAFGWKEQFGIDPRSSDFLKVRLGDKTTVDTGAGYGQVVRLMARILSQSSVDQRGRKSKADIIDESARFLRYKLSPLPAVAVDIQQGRTAGGQPVTVGSELKALTVPISVQTMVEAVQEHGGNGLYLMIPDTLGLGVQVYQKPEKAARAPRQP